MFQVAPCIRPLHAQVYVQVLDTEITSPNHACTPSVTIAGTECNSFTIIIMHVHDYSIDFRYSGSLKYGHFNTGHI